MLFNSIDFAIFLPVVFFLYWFATFNNHHARNAIIVLASYLFYGWWDYRFLALIFFSTVVDYSVGLGMERFRHKTARLTLLFLSLSVNLGLLGFFKYFNFFQENFIKAFSLFGSEIAPTSLNIVLPVGISFYTFQTLSYSIDLYRKALHPTRDFLQFSAYVSFFPQLVAGPIERATHLLSQFGSIRNFEYRTAVDGLRQMLWGLFKKIVIADHCAVHANVIFGNSAELSGSTILLGTLFFAVQIYCDFSGYSDIAIGTARLFGIHLRRNFAFPYFSRDIAEFWRRWHISLSSWFRDYLYIPLGGSRGGTWKKIRNTFVIFIVSGFWHGANWTFIVWGALNAVYFLPLLLRQKNRAHLDNVASGSLFPSLSDLRRMCITFALTLLAWIFFRAENLTHAFACLAKIFSLSLFSLPRFYGMEESFITLGLVACFFIVEWLGRESQYAIEKLGLKWPSAARWALYYLIIFSIYQFSGEKQEFIYFQF